MLPTLARFSKSSIINSKVSFANKKNVNFNLTRRFASKRDDALAKVLSQQLKEIEAAGTYKKERIISSSQNSSISISYPKEQKVLNFCANNYLGLSDNKDLVDAAKKSMDKYGLGLSSVRFICGTQDIHKQLEKTIAKYHKKDDAILYTSAFDANGGLFDALFSPEDAIISDELNHASIIDGIRLAKGQKFRYKHLDMDDLKNQLEASKSARLKIIVTDGAFSMDGDIAPLDKICELADKYGALVFVDDCHATGFLGKTGRGSAEHFGVEDRVDIINSTLGKALGGALGGYTTARQEVVDILRQRSRPYLFSNTLPPAIVGATLKVFDMISNNTTLRDRLEQNMIHFRSKIKEAGFDILGQHHPVVPIMLYDAKLATDFANDMLNKGIYVVGFSFPVVPKGKARIRVQLSAAHTKEQIDTCIKAFIDVGKQRGVIKK